MGDQPGGMFSWFRRLLGREGPRPRPDDLAEKITPTPDPQPEHKPTPSPEAVPDATPVSAADVVPAMIPDPTLPEPEEEELPDWAGFFTSADNLKAFERLVVEELSRRGDEYRYSDGVVHAQVAGEDQSWGMSNLGQICAAAPRQEWPRIITLHFDAMTRAAEQRSQIETLLKDYTTAKRKLFPRLWEPEQLGPAAENAIIRHDIPSLATVLCADLPDVVQTVPPDLLARWGVGEDQAFARAMDNLDQISTRGLTPIRLGDDVELLALEDMSFFTASVALRIDDFHRLRAPLGVMVALPTRHLLLALPLHSAADVHHLQHLISVALHAEARGPGSLSKRVWWRYEGVWREVPYLIDGNKLSVYPPQELARLLGGEPDSEFPNDPDNDDSR